MEKPVLADRRVSLGKAEAAERPGAAERQGAAERRGAGVRAEQRFPMPVDLSNRMGG